jgi:putative restriction endonuclease
MRNLTAVPATESWLERVANIRQWTRNGERAPHKPLLLLYALGRLQRTGTTEVKYSEAEPALAHLLQDFGPPGRKSSPAYPFHHLQSDGLWSVTTATGATPGSSPTQLRDLAASGHLAPDFEAALRTDPALLVLAAHSLLDANWPESFHADISAQVGLDLQAVETQAAKQRASSLRRRDPAFRDLVLMAYEYRCAICGYDGRLGTEAVGLDAAHVRWWAFEGPDTVDNALCLCSMHHKLLDRGVVGIDARNTVAVSARFVGRGRAAEVLVLEMLGRPLLEPQYGHLPPAPAHVQWHHNQVFSGPARIPA